MQRRLEHIAFEDYAYNTPDPGRFSKLNAATMEPRYRRGSFKRLSPSLSRLGQIFTADLFPILCVIWHMLPGETRLFCTT